MTKTKILLLVLLAGTTKLLYDAGGTLPAPESEQERTGPAVVVHTAAARSQVERGLGVFGARLARPWVRSIVGDTRVDLDELDVALAKAPKQRALRAGKLKQRIAELDSTAYVRLDEGRPLNAIQLALQGSGLAEAMRDNLVEEVVLK